MRNPSDKPSISTAPPLDGPTLALYRQLAGTAGFRERPAQLRMMEAVTAALRHANPSREERGTPGRAIAVISAPTGLGKSIGYALPACALAPSLGLVVVIATATVALQEQLLHHDLPRLQAHLPGLRIAIAKGRGRYVCTKRLTNDLRGERHAPNDEVVAADLLERLRAGSWAGDIDSLPDSPCPELWGRMAAHHDDCCHRPP